MINYTAFFEEVKNTPLEALSQNLGEQVAENLCIKRHGDLPRWYQALDALPSIAPAAIALKDHITIGSHTDGSAAQRQSLREQLLALKPWRKGPYQVFDTFIDTEWRSDWKWQRLLPHINTLQGKTILDVGCGNGYHCLRMFGAGAKRVVGIDPSPRFVVQFYMLKKYLGNIAVDVLPMGIETLPKNLGLFDTTFSMGVLYHRRSPMDHLKELKDTLKPDGELVLETLVVDGPLGYSLVPEGRYAMMNNVWFLPSSLTLVNWLSKLGFDRIRIVDENTTGLAEQRATDWMQYHSLANFLDPNNTSLTIEGHPAPKRAIILARKRT